MSVVKEQKPQKTVVTDSVEEKETADELAEDLEELKKMDTLPEEE